MEDVKLAARQQGLVAFELYGATYGSGGIGRESTNFSLLAQSYFTTQLQTDVLTVKTEHALATNSASFFGTFEFLALSVLFFVVSLCLFVHSLVSYRRIETEKGTPLLDLLSKLSYVTSRDLSRNEASYDGNQSPMHHVLHPSNAHSTLPEPLTDKVLPVNKAGNLSPKQERPDARSGKTSKKSKKSLKQYFKRIRPT
jgi:hypothetical protein